MLLAPFLFGVPAFAGRGETVRCAVDDRRDVACRMTDRVGKDGRHTMTFTGEGVRVTFVGSDQTGWWSGRLNGRPAMGYERNRGNTVFATTDLKHTFAWWYAHAEHGTY